MDLDVLLDICVGVPVCLSLKSVFLFTPVGVLLFVSVEQLEASLSLSLSLCPTPSPFLPLAVTVHPFELDKQAGLQSYW